MDNSILGAEMKFRRTGQWTAISMGCPRSWFPALPNSGWTSALASCEHTAHEEGKLGGVSYLRVSSRSVFLQSHLLVSKSAIMVYVKVLTLKDTKI